LNYKTKWFRIEELVSQARYNDFVDREKEYQLWWLFDPGILKAADNIRSYYGRMVANTWLWGGVHNYRGFRGPSCTIGADDSQHRFGRALDLVPLDTPVEDIRRDIIRGDFIGGDFITCIEIGIPWLHIDGRNYKGLLQIRP